MPQQHWHLVSAHHGGRSVAAIAVADELFAPKFLAPYPGAFEVIRDWEATNIALRTWSPEPSEVIVGAKRLLPLAYPRKVLCSGPNYSDHLAEMGETGLGDDWTAYFFLKPPTTTLVSDGDPILIDDVERDRVDWEGELGVVIGRGGRHIASESALDHVAGYLVANDISLRGPHRRDTPAKPFQWDWLASKGADTSLPIGPGIVPAWQIPDPQALSIVTRVNEQVRQDGKTSDMVLDIAHLIADASRLVTLEAGDLILTGTPAGVGASSGAFLADGDEVEVSISGIGTIRNRVEQRSS
jgi:2-keto-4-pentenoate hydratase/2-oxohepta-3-ene-1,7-dioic acid hydratase in catechol pathway